MKIFWICVLIWAFIFGKCDAQGATWWHKHASKFTCQRPGYFVNEADCHNFYRCVDRSTWDKPALQRYDFTCPNGMVFDPAVSVCTEPGPNGCAEPWWPENVSGERPRPPTGSLGGANKPGRPAEGNSVESLPSIFESSKGPGGRRPVVNRPSGGGSDSPWFQKPNTIPSSPAGGNPFSPGGGGGSTEDLDPLDIDFGSSPDSETKPSTPSSSSNPFGPGSGSSSGNGGDLELDPLDIDFGSSPPASENRGNNNPFNRPSNPASQGSSNNPFGSGGGNDVDPLDIDFGSPQDTNSESGFNRPSAPIKDGSFSSGGTRPSNPFTPGTPGGPFGGSSNNVDPLDIDFGASPDSGAISTQSPNASRPPPSWGSSESTTQSPSSNNDKTNRPRPGGTNFWDRNDFPESPSELDSWGGNELGQGGNSNNNRPWGGSQRPGSSSSTPPPSSFDNAPWRPIGPWGSGPPPRPGSASGAPSWWDPPVALPLRPSDPRITPPDSLSSPRPANPRITAPPPPPPWANPFRPRYPVYEIVAYPTWPGPMNRRPIIVVYSNSRK